MNNYDVIIGLEIHIQNKTKSKMFCTCSTDYFQKEPNTLTCPACLGMPGALPVPNRRAIELCILMGLATHCKIADIVRFDRKHYFYPDLPKGYQISQYDNPICSDGYVDVVVNGEEKRVEIERIHQEEDVAKSTHHKEKNSGKEYTLVDYNKSGMPLIEIVTKPVIRSAGEAKEYANRIRQIARYVGASDADMEKGQMRCEPNVSVQVKGTWEYKDGKIFPKEGYTLNPKVEIKNIGSISAVEKSILYEVDRLIKEIESGSKIVQQTRGWDADRGVTTFQRSKESAQDYRYLPDPDIPLIQITDKDIKEISKELPELPSEKYERYVKDYGLSSYDSDVLSQDRNTAQYYDQLVEVLKKQFDIKEAAKEGANWLTGIIFGLSNDLNKPITDILSVEFFEDFKDLISAIKSKQITSSKGKEIFDSAVRENKIQELSDMVKQSVSSVVTDDSAIETMARDVLEANEKAVKEYKGGKTTVIMFLVGQLMREAKGNVNPTTAKEILEKLLS